MSGSWRGVHAVTEPEDRSAPDDEAMRRRLAALSRDLSLKGNQKPEEKPSAKPADTGMGQALSLGMRVTSEFVGTIVVGALIGWLIDRWLHSSPVALILFIGLGTAAGFWTIYKLATKTGGK
jgi:ATP synthase protein I